MYSTGDGWSDRECYICVIRDKSASLLVFPDMGHPNQTADSTELFEKGFLELNDLDQRKNYSEEHTEDYNPTLLPHSIC